MVPRRRLRPRRLRAGHPELPPRRPRLPAPGRPGRRALRRLGQPRPARPGRRPRLGAGQHRRLRRRSGQRHRLRRVGRRRQRAGPPRLPGGRRPVPAGRRPEPVHPPAAHPGPGHGRRRAGAAPASASVPASSTGCFAVPVPALLDAQAGFVGPELFTAFAPTPDGTVLPGPVVDGGRGAGRAAPDRHQPRRALPVHRPRRPHRQRRRRRAAQGGARAIAGDGADALVAAYAAARPGRAPGQLGASIAGDDAFWLPAIGLAEARRAADVDVPLRLGHARLRRRARRLPRRRAAVRVRHPRRGTRLRRRRARAAGASPPPCTARGWRSPRPATRAGPPTTVDRRATMRFDDGERRRGRSRRRPADVAACWDRSSGLA